MPCSRHEWSLDLYRSDGSLAGTARIGPDWEPALEHALFEALRSDQRLQGLPSPDGARVDPVWSRAAGEPHAAGFRVAWREDGRESGCAFTLRYFRAAAVAAAEELTRRGALDPGETFLYSARAEPDPDRAAGPGTSAIPLDLRLLPLPLASLLAGSPRLGPPPAGEFPVFIAREVLVECAVRARLAAPNETGAFLTGRLARDPASGEIAALVTGSVEAAHLLPDVARLTFTPETWAAARRALAGRDELILCWFHSHPVAAWRAEAGASSGEAPTPPSSRQGEFFSAYDCHLHRVAFPRAYQTALLVSQAGPADSSWTLFGWLEGVIGERGFYVLDARTWRSAGVKGDGNGD